tara:strand:+ start:36298 stop:37455 length:1158 start_codon:yes stop_codon:yes gene_type:complete
MITPVTCCRICGSSVNTVADLGSIHINDFPEKPGQTKGTAPLILEQCDACTLVQLKHTVDPNILYGDHYWYQSGLNPKLKANLLDIADYANKNTQPGDIVLDIGANDGTLLSGVKTDRVRYGCEPAPNLQEKLINHADVVINDLWHYMYMNGEIAQFITAIGMFYDMDDPNEFIHSVRESLASDGIFVAQLMTLAPMLRMKDLGNICHEHLEYYTYKSLVELYERNGLEIYHVEENDIQGGSYQIWARHLNKGSIQYAEDVAGLQEFLSSITQTKQKLHTILKQYQADGKNCYVYGASTKGNTLLQIWDIGNYFKGAAEIHTDKFGRYTVGTDIPIIDEKQAKLDADVFFVPNFGFRDLFVEKEAQWIAQGGEMLFAMPEVAVVK